MTKATGKQAWAEKQKHSKGILENYVVGFDGLSYQERMKKAERELLDAVKVGLMAARTMAGNQRREPDWLDEIEAIVLREMARTNRSQNELN